MTINLAAKGFVLLFCLAYTFHAMALPFGTLKSPGVGFVPLIAGFGGVIFASAALYSELRKRSDPHLKLNLHAARRAFIYVAALAVYVATLQLFGFMLSSALLLIALFKVSGVKGWALPTSSAVVVAAAFYLVSARLLAVNLP